MTMNKRMPPLTMDEVLLLVDTYFCMQNVKNNDIKWDMVIELSKAMRALPFYRELSGMPAFRSVDGMKMCLANVAGADPCSHSKFDHGSIAQRRVLAYYADKKPDLHAYALAIRKVAQVDFPVRSEFSNFIGGALLPSYHCYIESTNKSIKAVLKEAGAQLQTECRICGQDLSDIYGSYASELIEIHINLPLSYNTQGLYVSPSDLVLLCPTCHKCAHINPQHFETNRLLSVIKAGF